MNAIDNTQVIIDSRDVIARIAELERDEETLDEEEQAELAALRALADDVSGSPGWAYGEILIRGSYFVEYAQEFAEDIGAITRAAPWPYDCIDWDHAARELRYDYFSVDFDGVEYWIRG